MNRSIHPCSPAADAAHLEMVGSGLHDAADATLQAVRDAFDAYHDSGAIAADGRVLEALASATRAYARAGGVS